jgi:hypothetical protein
MEMSPSWEAANCAATQQLPSILCNPEVHYPPLVPILSQINLNSIRHWTTIYRPIPLHKTRRSETYEYVCKRWAWENVIKSSIFRDISSYYQLKVRQRFGGTCCLHLQVEEYAKDEASMKYIGRRAVRLPNVRLLCRKRGEKHKTAHQISLARSKNRVNQ